MINTITTGTGKPLVLFHGWGFDSSIWAGIVPILSAQYQLHCVDLPGFGLTPMQSDTDFMAELMQQLPPTFTVLGWSLGGLYATKLAYACPERVTQLINITTSPYFLNDAGWPGIDKAVFNTFCENVITNTQAALNAFLQLQGASSYKGVLPSKAALLYGLECLSTWDLRAILPQIYCPIHYLFGRLDSITSRRLMPHMQKAYPQIHYTQFDKAAHAPFLSHEAAFIDYINAILGE